MAGEPFVPAPGSIFYAYDPGYEGDYVVHKCLCKTVRESDGEIEASVVYDWHAEYPDDVEEDWEHTTSVYREHAFETEADAWLFVARGFEKQAADIRERWESKGETTE